MSDAALLMLLDGDGVIHSPLSDVSGTWLPLCVVRDGLTYVFDRRYMLASLVPCPVTCVRCTVYDQRRYFP